MEKIISACGLTCSECPVYIATINNDDNLRKQIAEKGNHKPEEINCLSCYSDVLIDYCKTCNIRECNVEKGTKNCGECASYPCDKIEEFIKMVPSVKPTLDEIHKNKN